MKRLRTRRVAVAALVGIGLAVATLTLSKSGQDGAASAATVDSGKAVTASAASQLPPLDPHAIAVIPFVDLAASSDTARFAVALSESVRSGLASTSQLRIAAASVTLTALEAGGDIREAARRLGTGFVLTGTIDREGNVLRLSLQLVSAEDGFSRWATTIEGEANQRFEFEKRVARNITSSVVAAVLGDSAAGVPPGDLAPR